MEKREYKRMFKVFLNDLPIEKIHLEIKRIKSALNEYEQEIGNKINKRYYLCSNCGKYSFKKEWKSETAKVTRYGVTVYVDCGYGDDDEIADITYNAKYRICPKCGHKVLEKSMPISESNRRTRR